MKDTRRKLLALALGASTALAGGCGHVATSPTAARAGDRQPEPSQERQDERVFVTGSRIPQRVDTSTGLPATASPLRVYSRRDLTSTGRPETGDALRRLDPSMP